MAEDEGEAEEARGEQAERALAGFIVVAQTEDGRGHSNSGTLVKDEYPPRRAERDRRRLANSRRRHFAPGKTIAGDVIGQ